MVMKKPDHLNHIIRLISKAGSYSQATTDSDNFRKNVCKCNFAVLQRVPPFIVAKRQLLLAFSRKETIFLF